MLVTIFHFSLLTLAFASPLLDPRQYEAAVPCGRDGYCPAGLACMPVDPKCKDLGSCTGECRAPEPVKYPACGYNNETQTEVACEVGQQCIDDPRPRTEEGCGDTCGKICIPEKPTFCGGFAGFMCQEPGKGCYDNPNDGCDPNMGGRDCGGICV